MMLLTMLQAGDTAAPPIPAAIPIAAGPLWSLVVPALLLIFTAVSTYLLYRRFEREESKK